VCAILLLISSGAFAQARDSSVASVRDTVASRDTVRVPSSPSGIDTVVTYTAADSIVYDLNVRRMFMYGKGTIHHKDLGLKADRITIDWTQSTLNAMGVKDTADTLGQRYVGKPEMIDGAETYRGFTIDYNFKSRKGRIDLGKTEIEKGFYAGETIKKVESDILYVEDGRFTSCDLEHPHYFFGSPTMKVVVKDRIIARPIFLAIDDVPVFALPFGVFPSQRGRRSGLIAPAYGQSTLGRYLLHLGYYWAMSDYTDLALRADGYTKGSWALYGDFRYALRYLFNGGVSASMKTTVTREPGDPGYGRQRDFNIYLNHAQQFDPTARLVVDFTFTTGSYYANTTTSYADLLRQNVVSNATFTKWWEGTPNSLTINIRRDQNLQPKAGEVEVSDLLPSVSFSRSQTYPFRGSESSVSGEKWYELFGYSYSGTFLNRKTKTKLTEGYHLDNRFGAQHHLTPNFTPHVGYFSVSPFFNYTENWYTKSIRRFSVPDTSGADSLITEDVNGFHAVRYYDMGVAISTKLYGMLQPGIFGIRGIRHQLTPSLRYTFHPDFADPKYGYFQTYKDVRGRDVAYSIFEREVYGGPSPGKSQSIGFDVGNVFEMKTASSDTAQEEHKVQLLNLSAGISYNFAADSLRFSEINMSYRTAIGELLNISGSASFNLYAFEPFPRLRPTDPITGHRVNRFLINSGGGLAQLTNFSISVGTRFSGEKTTSKAGPVRTEADSLNDRMKRGYVGLYDTPVPDFSIPWNLDLTLNFSQNQSNPYQKFIGTSLMGNLGFNLTENWKFTASSSYDIRTRQFAAPQITVYRDLHCWELNFSWVPLGTNRNYRLEIRLKAPQLQDIKVTRQTSASGLY
jgi:lipopolysaccharide assembly outer membrane protein LptD (OstA)